RNVQGSERRSADPLSQLRPRRAVSVPRVVRQPRPDLPERVTEAPMNSAKKQISRRDSLMLGLAGLTVSPWGAPFYARAATEEKMTIAKVEVDRFSITC